VWHYLNTCLRQPGGQELLEALDGILGLGRSTFRINEDSDHPLLHSLS
jgi:hypothetical protein